MGRIKQGANGGFSGKAGSVIGSSWKGIEYIKGRPKVSNKPATQRQLEQQTVSGDYPGYVVKILISKYFYAELMLNQN